MSLQTHGAVGLPCCREAAASPRLELRWGDLMSPIAWWIWPSRWIAFGRWIDSVAARGPPGSPAVPGPAALPNVLGPGAFPELLGPGAWPGAPGKVSVATRVSTAIAASKRRSWNSARPSM